MFYGYPIAQWLEVLEWFIMMIGLFTGIFIFSCFIVNKTDLLHTNTNNKKIILNPRKQKRKVILLMLPK